MKDISEGTSDHLSSAALPLSALRLLVPPLRLASAAIWRTVLQKDVSDYGILEEFVSMVTDIVPELLTRRQKAQLTMGLRAQVILNLCQASSELELLQPHLDRMQVLIESWLLESGAADPEIPNSNFVDLIEDLLKNPEEKENFLQKVFSEEFGPTYSEAVQELMWLFLTRLEKLLPVQTFHQVASMFSEVPRLVEECVSECQCDGIKTLLQRQKDLNRLDPDDIFLDRPCIISALKLPFLPTRETFKAQVEGRILDDVLSCASPVEEDSPASLHVAQMNSDAATDHLTGDLTIDKTSLIPVEIGTQLRLGEQKRPAEHSGVLESQRSVSCLVKECCVQLKRLDRSVPTNSRPVRANRGLRMKQFLQEEKRLARPANKSASRKSKPSSSTSTEASDEEDSSHADKDSLYMAPISTGTEEDSWSYYSEASRQSNRSSDSWSFYSDENDEDDKDEDYFATPASSSAESDLTFSASNRDISSTGSKKTAASSQKPRLSNNKGSTPKKTRDFLCFICKEHVDTNLRTHMKTHFPNKDYACPQCDTRYKLLTSLLRHLKKTCFDYALQDVHPDQLDETQNLSKCNKCGSAFRYKISLQRHMMTHHELYCSVCRRVLRDAETLARHKTSHTPFQCTRCDQSFTVFKHLIRHYENVHNVSRPFKCNHCPNVSTKLRFLIKHEWRHTGHLPFQCAQCNSKFRSDSDLQSHQRVHTREKPYLCAECGKTFARKSNLSRHLRHLHGAAQNERKYSCSQCEKSFKEKGSLKKHQRSKHLHELFRYPCPYCGKMVSSSAMGRHKLIHTGERPFKCTVPGCGKCFRSKPEVKRHVLLHHTNERPFKCDTCDKGFVRMSDLRSHARIHSQEKPCVCHICGKAFLKAYSMFRHKRLLHGFIKH